MLVARDLGPADVAELGREAWGVALAAGGVMAHAAIVAAALGMPMVVGLGRGNSGRPPGTPVVVDGGAAVALSARRRGAVPPRAAQRGGRAERARRARVPAGGDPRRPPGPGPLQRGVGGRGRRGASAGAEGVGLFRTELASSTPRLAQRGRAPRQAAPVLASLAGRTATVRVLDFGGDKTPPFLRDSSERGLALMLEHPDALAAQLRGAGDAGRHTRLRILLPMVELPDQVGAVRSMLSGIEGGAEVGVGAMIETRGGGRARGIAGAADFISIGTNDLTHSVLATDRFAPGSSPTHHPAVLRAIAAVVKAATAAGLLVEVCGEAASNPVTMPVRVGLGVGELSVGAARVGEVRAGSARSPSRSAGRRAGARGLRRGRGSPDRGAGVAATAKAADAAGEGLEGVPGVVALGGPP